jgi:hypothetical protein
MNDYKKQIILLILFLLFIFYLYTQKYIYIREKYENNIDHTNNINSTNNNINDKNNITIIIARYKEDLSYLLSDEFKDYPNIIIYNKGDEIKDKEIIKRCKIVPLPNVGKCDHTYLHHIIENYQNLSNVTIFLPGSFYKMEQKRTNAYLVMKKVDETKNTVFPVINFNVPVWENELLYNYVEETYVTRYTDNQDSENNKNIKTTLSPIRPYGVWFDHNFPNNTCPYVTFMGIFAISKEDIHKHPVEKYKDLISYVDKDLNPEAAFFIERCWVPLFYPIDQYKLIENVDFIW